MNNDGSSRRKLLNNFKQQLPVALLIVSAIISPQAPLLAAETTTFSGIANKSIISIFNERSDDTSLSGKVKARRVVSTMTRAISAYNVGDVNQCDGDPCTSANGENICKALEMGYKRCAANFVPFGTILEIEGYGECMVTDRMNSRYPNNVDIAMKYEDRPEALKFGRRRLEVSIIKYE